jgi:hypothetical protein
MVTLQANAGPEIINRGCNPVGRRGVVMVRHQLGRGLTAVAVLVFDLLIRLDPR